MVLLVLREYINSTENMAVFGFKLILCDNMDIFYGFRPSAIFYYIVAIILSLKYETGIYHYSNRCRLFG